jgi:multicomponent K+:H+ antiporter subunit A
MKVPVEILVVLVVAVGTFPGLTVRPVLESAAQAVVQRPLPTFSLAIWHGFNLPLVMSIFALAGGALLYANRRWVFATHDLIPFRVSGKALTEGILERVFEAGHRLDALIDNRSLPRYVLLLLFCSVAAGVAGYWGEPIGGDGPMTPIGLDVLVGGLLLGTGAIATAVWHRHRLRALLLLGLVGLMVSLFFARFSAPDLALTQLLIEIATLILILLALYYLPRGTRAHSSPARRARDALLALAVGSGTAVLCYAMLTQGSDSISAFHLAESKPGGGGTNVVNVTLVDFRGFDTLGEVTVLGIAALGILGMLDGLFVRGPDRDPQGRPWSRDPRPLILVILSRLLLPMALLVAVWLFLRGHNEPGGGFIAGLVAGVALILEYIAEGSRDTDRRMRWNLVGLIGVGISIATLTGLGSWLLGYPFLTSSFGYLTLPVIGTFELTSVMLFDLGVFLVVLGTLLLVLSGIGRLSLAEEEHP